MAEPSLNGKSALPVRLRSFPRVAGVVAMLLGLMTIIGWLAHWRLAVQWLPGSAPMHFKY